MRKFLVLLLVLTSVALADHPQCEGGFKWQKPDQIVQLDQPLEKDLLTVNPYRLTNEHLKKELLEDYGSQIKLDEHFHSTEVCIFSNETYIRIWDNDFGQYFHIATSMSDCSRCFEVGETELPRYAMDIKLKSSVSEVGSVLGFPLEANTVRINFESIVDSPDYPDWLLWHVQSVDFQFNNGKLESIFGRHYHEVYDSKP